MLTAVLLTFAHTHIHFSRQVAVSYIYAAFFLPIVLWGIWQLVSTRKAWPAVIAAFMLSMHANFYVDAWAWAVLTVLILASWFVVEREVVVAASPAIVVYAGMALIGYGPQLVWAMLLPGEFYSRLSTDGSFVSGWVYLEAVANNVSVLQFVLYLYKTALEAILTSPFIDFYHADVPILDAMSAVLFGIGTVIVHNRMHTRRGMIVLGWFWGGVTALAVFTLPVSTYHYRLFVIVPVLIIQVSIGLEWIWGLLERWMSARVALVLVGETVIAIAGVNTTIYVTRLAQVCRYGGDQQTQRAGAAARYLQEHNIRDTEVIIVGELNNMHAGTWKSFEYLNESLHFSNSFPEDTYDFLPFKGKDIYLLYTPERFMERNAIQAGLVELGDYETITMCEEVFGYLTHVRVE
jgi:hypothetical protein